MTTHDTSIVDVKSATGWSLGWAAHCATCDWYDEPRERPGLALIDVEKHTRKTEDTTDGR